MDFESIRRKKGEAPYKTSPKSDVEPKKLNGGNMRYLLSAIFSSLLIFSLALGEEKMEARVYFQTADELFAKLGDFFSDLDIATGGETETGESYIVIITTEEELNTIKEKGLRVEITYPDIKEKFRLMTGVDPNNPELLRDFGYYFTYWEMIDTLNRLKANYPSVCSLMNIGVSHQGRPLWTLKISDNPTVDESEPAVYINGATHAREPLGTHCCIDFASWILTNYGLDSTITWLVNNREIYITPVMNPDGYVYNSDSGGASANWRKNRRIIQSPYVGVDLNRNYGYKWAYDNSGSSGSPSSETYRGPSRFSEPETRVVRDFMLAQKIRTQMDYHTYGQYNMYSWGYASVTPPDEITLREMVDTFRMYNQYPASRTGQISRVLYTANGVSTDWEYADTLWEGNRKFVTYAFTIEMGTTDFWYGWNNPSYVDNECRLNRNNNFYLTRLAGVFFEPAGVIINDTLQGNRSGKLDPGEDAYVWFKFRNRAVHSLDSAYSISFVVRSLDPRVILVDSTFSMPVIRRKEEANSRAAMLRISATRDIPPGTIVRLKMIISYLNDELAMSQPIDYQITIGNIVSITEGENKRPFSPIPNPSRGHLNRLFNYLSGEDITLKILGADGRTLREVKGKDTAQDLILKEGIYFVEIKKGKEKEIRKLVVVK